MTNVIVSKRAKRAKRGLFAKRAKRAKLLLILPRKPKPYLSLGRARRFGASG